LIQLSVAILKNEEKKPTRKYETTNTIPARGSSAAIYAMGERGGNRNRVTGQEIYFEASGV
jgi:hypothetical protein